MIKKILKSQYVPDTPAEWNYISKSINRLGIMMSGVSLLSDNILWTLTALGFTWAGQEIAGYMEQYTAKVAKEESELK